MTETTRKKAEKTIAQLEEVTAVVLAEPAGEIVPLKDAKKPVATAIKKRMAEIDMGDTNSIIAFGSGAQDELREISQAMLVDVRNKDVGPAGDSLRHMVTTIRGFSVSELDVHRRRQRAPRFPKRYRDPAGCSVRFR